MKYLVDTHALYWWMTGHRSLSRRAQDILEASEPTILISAVIPWELATKLRIGKWPGAEPVLAGIGDIQSRERLTPLPITLDHARLAGLLDSDHRDPFDRLLAAQTEIEGAALVTADPVFGRLGTPVIW